MKRFFTPPLLFLLTVLTTLTASAQADGDEHVRLTNLPHIYVNTFSGSNPVSRNVMVYARMWYVDEQDHVAFYDSLQIRVRGNSTASLAKKPYKVKLAQKAKLLGKGFANTKKWTLLANHGDKSLLRNALTSLMGERAGLPFNPAAKFVDLTMNGRYVGNYQLSDQVDVRAHRVDVAEQDYPLTETSNVTGGYLVEVDGFRDFSTQAGAYQAPSGFYSSRRSVPIRIHYPEEEEIVPEQYEYIQAAVNNFEQRLFSQDFTHPDQGYRPLVDSMTLANWYICTEVSANVDGFWSTYFYKEQDDDRFYWGPLWDYDIAYNNDNRTDRGGTNSTTRQLMKDYGYGDRGSGCKPWVQQMWRDPWFARLINRRYRELVGGGLEQYLYDKLDSLTTLIDASQQLNYERWGINTRTLRERVLYSSYDRYIDDLRMFIGHHIEFLASAFADLLPDSPDPTPKTPGFQADTNSYYAIANAGTGTYFDVNTMIDALCARHRDADSESQQWHLDNLANGYLFLTNRASGKALSDSSPEGTTATTNPGYAIILKDPDSLDVRQQWDFVLQSDGHYNIISRWSQHAANLSGGNAADGTNILSYTSDERNATSANRLWRIELAGTVQNDIADVPWQDYVLAYDPTTQRLHFGTDHPAELRMPVAIYDQRGRRVATFRATDGYDAAALPRGLYIVTWQHQGRQHSVKFMNVER